MSRNWEVELLGLLPDGVGEVPPFTKVVLEAVTSHGGLQGGAVALLRGSGPSPSLSEYYPYTADEASAHAAEIAPEKVASYSRLMSASQPLVAAEILAYVFIVRNFPILTGGPTAAPERQAA